MRSDISDLFAISSLTRKSKFLLLGSADRLPVDMMNRVRSLNLEHVSPAELMRQEISRRSPAAKARGDATLALLRRWFWARKPDAGFVLADFPATLLHAKVFDEWLDARNEALDAVLTSPGLPATSPLIEYYRDHGILVDTVAHAAP